MTPTEEEARLYNEIVSDWNSLMLHSNGKFKHMDFPTETRLRMAKIMRRMADRIERHAELTVTVGGDSEQEAA